jgi:hypothetical protein
MLGRPTTRARSSSFNSRTTLAGAPISITPGGKRFRSGTKLLAATIDWVPMCASFRINRTDADQHVIFSRAAAADQQLLAGIRVQNRAILHVGVFADDELIVVASE